MGTHVDVEALRALGREYRAAASIVDDAVRNHLSGMQFGASAAGRAYVAQGDQVRAALDGVTAALRAWSRAATEVAMVLRVSADRYRDADDRAAERVG
ncbi:Protein of unknown function (DUF2580) [Mycolicibacterium chubuense NBB4]|uniref:ESX-1 secretion-associated protein n=1 Tax=Mycolicibacterium chubuense (strain NBB4) TaxID=710421 RepID=I4BF19_MYCCN|nr:type VII secretion target [Mycolicibacterium chubuense]AFM15876.1 Protein of unknown function (DUF2580) [Mycolicibacterium chubuense NBB4]